MDGVRVAKGTRAEVEVPCQWCEAVGCPWDRIGARPICPDCQEQLALGEAEPLVERLVPRGCAVCAAASTVPYLTFPLQAAEPVEIDLCPGHFQALLGRRLDRYSFRTLARRLEDLGLNVQQVFLLHEAFYDESGRPLQPVRDA